MLKMLPILLLLLLSTIPARGADIDLGKDTYRGVTANAYLKPRLDVPGGETYLLTVLFSSVASDRTLSEGDVAVKITSANGKTAVPLRLNPVASSFQAEIQLSMDGESQVTIGSKLADDKKRIYRFYFTPDR